MNIFIIKSLYFFLFLTIIISLSIYFTEKLYTHSNIDDIKNKKNKEIMEYNLDKNKYSSINHNNTCLNNINCNNLNYIYSRGNNNSYINYE